MYVDTWVMADTFLTVTDSQGRPLALSRACQDEVALAKLTDGWLHGQIRNSEGEQMRPARDLLKRIQHRKNYR